MSKTVCIETDRGVDCLSFELRKESGRWELQGVHVVPAQGRSRELDNYRSGRIELNDRFGSVSFGSIV